jgi:hypothetical protein
MQLYLAVLMLEIVDVDSDDVLQCIRRRCCMNKSLRLKSLVCCGEEGEPSLGMQRSQRYVLRERCWVLRWRFHSFLEEKDAGQP